jgi:hypothetical protein
MKHKRNWIIGIILSATAGFLAIRNVAAPSQESVIPDSGTAPSESAPIDLETNTPEIESCYFVWAYRDALELTEKLDASVKSINPNARAHATLFGEDCIYADGHSIFSAMQTDFYVRLPVDNSINEATLGNWMALVLELIVQLPRAEVQGNYGFVEFWFEKAQANPIFVRVPIQKYLDEARGKKGTELFQMFHSQP